MIQSLSDIIVVSDMDNTLLTAENGIPSCNIETIKLFTALGGKFTVATGRTIESVRHYLKDLPLSAPAITYGGSVIYDFAQESRIKNKTINKNSAINAIKDILNNFSGVGVEIMAENNRIYVVRANEYTYHHTLYEKLEYIMAGYDDINSGWNKVLFATSNKQQQQISDFINQKKYEDIYFIATHKNYFEIMSNMASKGTALKELCAHCKIPIENSFAIGDYYNDLELMKASGYAVAVGNAPKQVQLEANEVIESCKDGGVGHFLYSLIKKYEK